MIDLPAAFETLQPHLPWLTREAFLRRFETDADRRAFEHVVQTLLNRIHEGRQPTFGGDGTSY